MLTSNWNQNQISIVIIIKITFRLWTQIYTEFQIENLILKNPSLKKKIRFKIWDGDGYM
jgi:hypothetical protein